MGLHAGRLRVRIAAPPVDGAANLELLRFLAQVLDVPRSSISLLGGEAAKQKLLHVRGMSLDAVRHKLLSPSS